MIRKKPKHTPGPWDIEYTSDNEVRLLRDQRQRRRMFAIFHFLNKHDLQLIKAAPSLAKALAEAYPTVPPRLVAIVQSALQEAGYLK